MQQYTQNILYKDAPLGNIVRVPVPHFARLKLDPLHPLYSQTQEDFSQVRYQYPVLPLYLGRHKIAQEVLEGISLNVLRLLVRTNDANEDLFLPEAFLPLAPLLVQSVNYHRQYFQANQNAFLYLTVRCSSRNRNDYPQAGGWHVDGFQGAKIARHQVEQNMLWSNHSSSQFLLQPFWCAHLDPVRFDINEFFDRNANEAFAYAGVEGGMYMINPYHVHRASPVMQREDQRVFVRLNFSPVRIVDPSNSPSVLESQCVPQLHQDVRNFLEAYPLDESPASGFQKL